MQKKIQLNTSFKYDLLINDIPLIFTRIFLNNFEIDGISMIQSHNEPIRYASIVEYWKLIAEYWKPE